MYNPWEYVYDGKCGDCVNFNPCPHCQEWGYCTDIGDWTNAEDTDCECGTWSDEALIRLQEEREAAQSDYENYLYDCWKDDQLFRED